MIQKLEKFNGLCLNCSIKIEGKTSRARYCSEKCKSALKYKNINFDKTCEICSKNFSCKHKNIRFCSRDCQDINYHNLMKHEDVSLVCKWCKKEFNVPYVDRNTRKVCSYSCSTKLTFSKLDKDVINDKISKKHIEGHKSGKLKAFWKGKKLSDNAKDKTRKTRENLGLNKSENNPMFGKKHSDKTKEKISKTRSGNIIQGKYNGIYKRGKYFSTKLNRDIYYQSSWEEKFFQYLDKDSSILTYLPQPLSLPYFYDQKRNYIPDILITYITGNQKIIEIKPFIFLKYMKNIAKFKAAEAYCKERNMLFEVWTELDNPYLEKEQL